MVDQASLKFELGYLKRADGSCLYADKETVVIASVFGPGDIRAGKQIAERAVCELNFKPAICGTSTTENNFAVFLSEICESVIQLTRFPRTCISVTVQELHNEGNLCAASINAVCLALADSGLPMKCVFAAVSVALTEDKRLMVRPTLKEEKQAVATFCLVFQSTSPDDVAHCHADGLFSVKTFELAVEVGRKAAAELFSFYRATIERKLTRNFAEHSEIG